jgi:glycosyltransferase involved in cell wall biosynthesis
MTKQRILFFHHCSTIGGAGISGLNALKAIPQEFFEIIVFSNSEGYGMAELFQNAGFNVIAGGKSPVVFSHFSGGEFFSFSPYFFYNCYQIWKDFRKIKNVIYKLKPDIVIVNSMTLFWIGKIAKKYDIQTICFFRETYAKSLLGLRNRIIKYYLGHYFDKISFISNYDKEINSALPCFKTTIYNSINDSVRNFLNDSNKLLIQKKLDLQSDDFNILFVGGMSPLKGAHVIIEALKILN